MKLNCVIEKWFVCRCVYKYVFIFYNIINEIDDINIMGGGGLYVGLWNIYLVNVFKSIIVYYVCMCSYCYIVCFINYFLMIFFLYDSYVFILVENF